MTKAELLVKAKDLTDKQPCEASELFIRMWEEFRPEFTQYDATAFFKALKKCGKAYPKVESELIAIFQEAAVMRNTYAWVLYDRHIKNFDENQINKAEKGILLITELIQQKEFSQSKDTIPCPYTLGIFKLLKAYKKPNLNVEKVGFWLDKLDPDKLSRTQRSMNLQDGEIMELASDYETFLSIKAKYLEKKKEYEACIAICEEALTSIPNLHHDNDIWFRRLKALSLIRLGRNSEGEILLQELLKSRKAQKWFIKKELAELYFEAKDYIKALAYAVDAALTGKDYPLKTELFVLLARCFYKTDKTDAAANQARLLLSITKAEGRNIKTDHKRLYDYFKLNSDEVIPVNNILKACQKDWEEALYGEMQKESGVIQTIHANGKSGIIKAQAGTRFFPMSEVSGLKRGIKIAAGSSVEYFLKKAIGKTGKEELQAFKIKVIEHQKLLIPPNPDSLVGQKLLGTVRNVADFGVFVDLKQINAKGLIHKSNLGIKKNDVIEKLFKAGQKISVEIIKVGPKGLDLKYVGQG